MFRADLSGMDLKHTLATATLLVALTGCGYPQGPEGPASPLVTSGGCDASPEASVYVDSGVTADSATGACRELPDPATACGWTDPAKHGKAYTYCEGAWWLSQTCKVQNGVYCCLYEADGPVDAGPEASDAGRCFTCETEQRPQCEAYCGEIGGHIVDDGLPYPVTYSCCK